MNSNKNNRIIILSIFILVALIAAISFFPRGAKTTAESTAETAAEPAADTAVEPTSALSTYWAPDSPVAQSLRDYVSKVTDPADTDHFIPVKDRIAVFDMDGTLTCETYYTYYDTMMFIEFCLHDHPERVSDELKEVAAAIKPGYLADESLARNFAKAYAGMSMEEFYNYAVEFGKKPTASFENMRYIDNFYLPMAELVQYLHENDGHCPLCDSSPAELIAATFHVSKKTFKRAVGDLYRRHIITIDDNGLTLV